MKTSTRRVQPNIDEPIRHSLEVDKCGGIANDAGSSKCTENLFVIAALIAVFSLIFLGGAFAGKQDGMNVNTSFFRLLFALLVTSSLTVGAVSMWGFLNRSSKLTKVRGSEREQGK